jgi:predicted phage gp36 major capsid-like protein
MPPITGGMSRITHSRLVPVYALAIALVGCGQREADRAHPTPSVAAVRPASADAQSELRALRWQVHRAQIERDAAIAELHEALAYQRGLQARLAARATASRKAPIEAAAAHSPQVFTSLTTSQLP